MLIPIIAGLGAAAASGVFNRNRPNQQVTMPTPPNYRGTIDPHRGDIQQSQIENGRNAQNRLENISQQAEGQTDDFYARMAHLQGDIRGIEREGIRDINDQARRVRELPGQVREGNDARIAQFEEQSNVDLDRIESIGREAVAATQQGRGTAVEAAVQAQQGEVQRQIAEINSNPDIPPSMKQSMISRIRLTGSMSIASTVGTTVAQFNANQTAALNNMATNLTSLMQQQDSSRAGLLGAAMQTESSASLAAAELGNQLVGMESSLRQWGQNARLQTETTREQARQWNNQFQAALVPTEMEAGNLITSAHVSDLQLDMQALQMQFEAQLRTGGLQLQMIMAQMGNQNSLVNSILQGAQFGTTGMIMGGIGGVLGGFGTPQVNFG